MIEESFPLNSLVGVNGQHSPNDILSHLRNVIDLSGEPDWFILDVVDKINHVSCFVGRTEYKMNYNPKSIS